MTIYNLINTSDYNNIIGKIGSARRKPRHPQPDYNMPEIAYVVAMPNLIKTIRIKNEKEAKIHRKVRKQGGGI